MNYYERHIGDYLKDTAHLSLLEHGVYTRLLDVYYTRESPLPAADVARLIGARTRDEKAALDVVLAEFFQIDGDAYRQTRCDREIARLQDKRSKASASANARWSKREPQSDGNANASADAMRTHSEGNARAPVPRHQTPDTNTSPIGDGAGAPPVPADVIFGLGIPLLTAAQVAERNARSMLGLMRKTHGDDALIAALRRCAEEQPLQPVAWLQAALKAHAPNGKATKREAEVAKWLGPLAKQSEIIDMEPANGPRSALG